MKTNFKRPLALTHCAALASCIHLLVPTAVHALTLPGDIDPAFGGGTGIVTTAIGTVDDVANGVVVQPDGKIVLSGFSRTGAAGSRTENFALARYTTAGVLDTAFDGDGKRTDNLALYGMEDAAYGVGLQSDGKIVAGGYIFTNVWGAEVTLGFARYNISGSLDTSYGSSGHRELWFNSASRNFGATIGKKGFVMQPDGKAVMVGGLVDNNYGKIDFSVVRCGTNGIEDPTFGSNGRVRTEHVGYWNFANYGHDIAWDVALQADGKIIVVGESYSFSSTQFPASYNTDFSVVRYNSDGTLDPTFNGSGITITPISADKRDDVATTVAVQSDGKIMVAGYTYNTAKAATNFALVRYLPNGSLDPTFGTGGKVTTSLSAGSDQIFDIVIDGAFLVVAGVTSNGSNNDFAVARYTMNGALDPTFGIGGIRSFGIGGGNDQANAICIDDQGRYVVVGSSFNGTNDDFALVRLIAGPQAPTAVTMAATDITSMTATLNGTINAHGSSTTVSFEYGATTSYGTTVTAVPSPVTGHATTAVSVPLVGLSGGAIYHYRVKGVSIDGTSYGDDLTFTTLAVTAPAPIIFTIGGTPGDASSGSDAPDSAGTASTGKFDVLKRGGYLGENGTLVFPGQLLIGSGTPPVTVSPNTFMGLWKDNGSGLKLLARSGDDAPETGATAAKFDVLPQTPAINDAGEVTFLASLATNPSSTPPTTVDNDTGLWSELGSTGLGILIREGDAVPPLAPLQVGAFASGAFATAHTGAATGEAAFAVTLKNGSTDTAILRASVAGPTVTAIGVVARENTAMPGVAGELFGNLTGSYSDSIRMDATGNLAFVAISKTNRESMWYQANGGATTKAFIAGTAATGDPAPDTSGATFKNIKSPAIGSAGVIAFRGLLNANGDNAANLKNDGIWRGTTAGGFTCILRRGDDNTNRAGLGLPAGAKVGNLWHGWLTNANHTALRGWLDLNGDGSSASPADVQALYSDLSGTMALVIKVTDPAPDIAGATLATIDLPVVGGVEQMAFLGTVSGGGTTSANNSGVWRSAPNGGALTLVLRTGDTMTTTQGVKTIKKVDFPGSGSTDRRWEQPIMDSTGRLIVYVTFTDNATTQVLVP